MRIGLISDTHIPESLPELWPQVFDVFSDVDAILHAGDIHELFVLDQLAEIAPVWSARGNGEDGSGHRPRQPDHRTLRDAWVVDFDGVTVGIVHDMPIPEMPPGLTVSRAMKHHFDRTDLDVVVYGHSHVEAIDTIDGVLCVNPGSPTFPHNLETQLGTVGFLETNGDKPEATIWQLTDHGMEPFDWASSRRPW